ncbi:MAG: helix-turn-helix transcriptional regulator [Candidatus Bathyarchaeota archaeon]|nr:helix-turn-helix transcriptional regulator [Candidatus Bathyarchaeota archaeon]
MQTKLKVYRAMHNLTQEDLANAIGVTRQTVIAMEKGKYNPSLELAFKIARYFKVSIENVFIYDQNDKQSEKGRLNVE